jgi:hypothetical protein
MTKPATRPRSRANGATDLAAGESAPAPAEVSATAWIPRGELDQRQWAAAGRRLGKIGRGSQWWIGDWLHYGSARWGEKYAEAARITGYDAASLRNMAWVASQFDLSLRSDNLSWSHHVLLAPLEPAEQREWLQRATRDRFTVADLRAELRAADSGHSRASSPSSRPRTAAGAGAKPVVCPNCGHQLELAGDE